MTTPDQRLPALEREIDALLEAERQSPGPPTETRQRMKQRLLAAITAPVGPASGDGGPTAGPGAGPSTPTAGPAAGATAKALSLKPIALALVAAGALGGGVTLLLQQTSGDPAVTASARATRATTAPAPTPVAPAATAPAPAPASPAAPSPAAPSPNAESPAPTEPAPAVRPPTEAPTTEAPLPRAAARPSASRSTIAAERRLLEPARRALAADDAPRALRALAVHLERFPDGHLREEREALTILALVRAGRLDRARRLGARFSRRYPESIMLPVVRQALGR